MGDSLKLILPVMAGFFLMVPAHAAADQPESRQAPQRRARPLKAVYRGPAAVAEALTSGVARPLGLASADFNEDGYPDLVAAYDVSFGGALAVHRGVAARPGEQPFAIDTQALSAEERPDFVVAGDFNGDDHADIVFAARGGRHLYFLAGDGHGGFAPAETIELPGKITAFVTGEVNRADGLPDLAVAVSSAEGHRLLVFESPRGALQAGPEKFTLPAPATGVYLRLSADGAHRDVVVETAGAVYRLQGRDRKLAQPAELRKAAEAAVLERLEETAAAGEGPFTGAVASLRVRFSGARADSRVELPGDSRMPVISEGIGIGFVVNSSGDAGDGDVTDGVCDTGAPGHPTGICTLRAAIQQANFNAVAATITFTTAVGTITPGGVLPNATGPITIDGLSGRTVRVELDGRNTTGGDQIYDPSGIALYGGNSTLTGMAIFGFSTDVKVASTNSGGNTISSNWIGIDNTGAVPSGNKSTWGILLEGYPGAGDNLIGGTAAGEGNVISTGNSNGYGLEIASPGNTVEGNRIGTDPTGATLIGNGHPILISDSGNNTIGGTTAGSGNVVAGTTGTFCCGNVQISQSNAPATGNKVQGNYIGTDITGAVALGGTNGGVYGGGTSTTIGGTTAAARNVISGNSAYGVTLTQAAGLLEGNYIGTDPAGTSAVPNGCCGVQIQNSGSTVGGTAGAGNLISGNQGPGIAINQSGVTNSSVTGNIIGLNAAGTAALGNSGDGIGVTTVSASANIFGAAGAGNVISGNGGNGIASEAGSLTIQGNLVGTNAAGTAAIGNQLHGLSVNASNGATIGGAAAGQGNLISGNSSDGISLTASLNFTVQGNLVGTNAAGTAAIANGGNGILLAGGFIPGSCGSCPDSTGVVRGNTIANNAAVGIEEDYGFFVTFQGNSIFANPTAGIRLTGGSNSSILPPVLTAASLGGGMLQVQGSVPNAPYGFPATLEFFADSAGDSPAEGRTPLGTATVNATGNFNVSIATTSAAVVTATVTDHGGDTSAFSNALTLQTCAADVSAQSSVTRGATRYSAGQKQFLQADTLKNNGATAIAAPIYVAIDNLSANATLANAAGTLACNTPASPYVVALSSGSLAPGASIAVQLQFSDPSLAAFTYSTRVLAGAGQP